MTPSLFSGIKIVRHRNGRIAAQFFCRDLIRVIVVDRNPLQRLNVTPVHPHDQLFKALFYRLFPRPDQMKTGNLTFLLLLDAVVHAASVYYCIFIHYKTGLSLSANEECLLCEQTRNPASLLIGG
jgi:hypothetical protein